MSILLFVAPVAILLLPYIIADPFKALYHYDSYTPRNGEPMYININRSLVSTSRYIKNNPKYHYDSFIFGSSRSGFFQIRDWQTHIGDSTSCFHFDEYGGSLFMIHKKIRYINRYSHIKNALICIDDFVLVDSKAPSTPLHVCPPVLLDNKNCIDFQLTYLRAYLSLKFFPAYCCWLITKRLPFRVKSPSIIDTSPYISDEVTNEIGISANKYGYDYIATSEELLKPRPSIVSDYPDFIFEDERAMLCEIKQILETQQCDYRIVINPIFTQRKLSKNDMRILTELFGDRLYDFSGKNEITDNPNNYFDVVHFTSAVAKEIMDSVYTRSQ